MNKNTIKNRRKGFNDTVLTHTISKVMEKDKNKINVEIKFKGIDGFGRIVFKQIDKSVYYGSVRTLFPDSDLFPNGTVAEIKTYFREHISELEYFGTYFDCEPNGGINPNINLIIVD